MTAFDDFFDTQMGYLASRIDWRDISLIEYGAQHARHSLALLGMGARRAVAVEGRPSNLELVENPQKLPLVTHCADIRSLNGKLGKFDAALVLGVLYHLDRPAEFLRRELRRVKDHLFVWAHYTENPTLELDGYRGASYPEAATSKHCALEPYTSFWFAKDELARCLADNGFTVVDCVEMPTPISPQYKAVMIHARRRDVVAKTHRLVVARWNEDVSWARPYPHIIYDKGGAPLDATGLNVVRLSENPWHRESHTYLHHIISHYDELDPWTAFVQGSPFEHANNFQNEWCKEADFAWIGHWQARDDRRGKPHHVDVIPLGEAYTWITGKPAPNWFDFVAGAQFVASRERIRSKPLAFWQRVQALALEPEFADRGVIGIHERLWGYLLDE